MYIEAVMERIPNLSFANRKEAMRINDKRTG
jgi:hypothetical protein